MSRTVISGSYTMFSFVGNCQSVYQSDYATSSEWQCLYHCSISLSTFGVISVWILAFVAGTDGSVGKESICNAGDARDVGSILGSGRSPGGVHGNPLQYSCRESLMDRGAWWIIVHSVAKSQTWLKWLCLYAVM